MDEIPAGVIFRLVQPGEGAPGRMRAVILHIDEQQRRMVAVNRNIAADAIHDQNRSIGRCVARTDCFVALALDGTDLRYFETQIGVEKFGAKPSADRLIGFEHVERLLERARQWHEAKCAPLVIRHVPKTLGRGCAECHALPDAVDARMHEGAQCHVGAGCRVAYAKLDIELARRVFQRHVEDRAHPQRSPAASDRPYGRDESCVTGCPAASQRLKWICVPLPTASRSTTGVNVTRWPRRKATARAISRTMTASSAARIPAVGATVTSYWRGAYSGRKESGFAPTRRIAETKASPNAP